MSDSLALILVPGLPLFGFLLLSILGKRYFPKQSGMVGTMILFAACAIACMTAYRYFFEIGQVNGVYQHLTAYKYVWLPFTDTLSIDMGAIMDPISMLMIVVVTFVSLMVHIYSLGYMKGEERYAIYYSYLGLFTFSMLGLVLSTNIFQIYIFWELVGVSSFLLIGYYFDKPSAVAASKKAFIVTRFADAGFLIGILVLSYYTGTLDFDTMIQRLTMPGAELTAITTAGFFGISALTWGLVLVFMGGAGKSAMFPLHIWLPDAMEGPTPVSALIHAATMVVAGVYLVGRLFPVFAMSCPAALDVVAYVGIFSSMFAAVVACTQTDIKRVLAYSTMSQIGYMMFALGVSGYGEHGLGFTASFFHLFTHAMFKALLFLGAGAVIHYVHSNEMKDMGGLRKHMPVTHIVFLIACLAIAGFPGFAGFFSKEEILTAAHERNPIIYWCALATAGLTAFYMFRLYFSIFWNKHYTGHLKDHGHDAHHDDHHHGEAPWSMKIPLIILAVLSVASGWIHFGDFVSTDGSPMHSEFHLSAAALPVGLALVAIAIAMIMYGKENAMPAKIATTTRGLYRGALNKFYIDELYLFITKKILFGFFGPIAAWIDKNIVDGTMNFLGTVSENISDTFRQMQTGKVQTYAVYVFSGLLGFVILMVFLWR
jgi:NADH-quinone oxidoreductase subunit L